MSTVTTHSLHAMPMGPVLYLALELGETRWMLGFTTGLGQAPRMRPIKARDLEAVRREIGRALARFHLPAGTPVLSCYEAGREGFWLHRALLAAGIANRVVDASSIEVNRRARRAKTDRLDAQKLVTMLVRKVLGDPRVWHEVHVPAEGDEDARHLDRELDGLIRARTAVLSRMNGLLATQGLVLKLRGDVPAALAAVRRWDDTALPPRLRARLERAWTEAEHLRAQIDARKAERHATLCTGTTPAHAQMRRLVALRGIGDTLSSGLVREAFGWRAFRNQRQVGGYAGLGGTPYASGDVQREQGMSRAGNRYVRYLAIELAWLWLHYQPESALSRWYRTTFGGQGRIRQRIGIVALARKLLIALWRYLETGVVPEGAVTKA
jgi:transposase